MDELHELGDPYFAEELETLLRLHAQGGGLAILLTATLPLGQRARLACAFEAGAAGRTCAADPDHLNHGRKADHALDLSRAI